MKLLGSIEASVVGLSHLFRAAADSSGSQLKRLAVFLGKCHENAYGMSEIVLRRNLNIPADANAVAVLIPNPDKTNEREGNSTSGCIYVKVSMDGAPYLRKVDLKTCCNYSELSSALEKMFSCFTIGWSDEKLSIKASSHTSAMLFEFHSIIAAWEFNCSYKEEKEKQIVTGMDGGNLKADKGRKHLEEEYLELEEKV
ncbi:hypothetical protein POM88_011836 [Heracleum sosnowskyi]|uniref:Auxin-responsive protein n=1 Tax=Heracleum sosnowskyi TaxID=360622 RepID=A0AAD8IVL3_9APIA|nr:hypothetical protein POM88_011836 [Heracleum sosnowskyi]